MRRKNHKTHKGKFIDIVGSKQTSVSHTSRPLIAKDQTVVDPMVHATKISSQEFLRQEAADLPAKVQTKDAPGSSLPEQAETSASIQEETTKPAPVVASQPRQVFVANFKQKGHFLRTLTIVAIILIIIIVAAIYSYHYIK